MYYFITFQSIKIQYIISNEVNSEMNIFKIYITLKKMYNIRTLSQLTLIMPTLGNFCESLFFRFQTFD